MRNNWSSFVEAQLRSVNFYSKFFYYEYKGGITKSFKQVSFTLALGDYNTYKDGEIFKTPKISTEFRLWQQIALTQNIEHCLLEHRYRIEQRFNSSIGYRNRFRYKLSITRPLAVKKDLPTYFYVNMSEELFFSNQYSYFEQNRFFAGLGYKFSQKLSFQVGILNRYLYKSKPTKADNFLQLTCFYLLQKTVITDTKNINNSIAD